MYVKGVVSKITEFLMQIVTNGYVLEKSDGFLLF